MNLIRRFIRFFRSVYYEFTKVTWLGRNEVLGVTVMLILFVVIISIFVGVIDLFLGTIISIIL
ncbi:MAG: preprotein translocase subunit SecE [Endomicrobium sp.]|jgi:preprotein translocase subunit SecE|nr:preprotein translocase subunit SecE [Endomicrobium sp.]